MKIALASDLHLEFSPITLPNTENAKVLILSGDILIAHDLYQHPHPVQSPDSDVRWKPSAGQLRAIRFREFLNHVNLEYEHTIYIPGNHEFYHANFPDAIGWLRKETSKFSNIHFLENSQMKIDDVVFIGGTLWTDMNRSNPLTMQLIQNTMNDFQIIRHSGHNYRKFLPVDTVKEHHKTLNYFKSVIDDADPTKTYVVVGHHLPSEQSVHAMYKTDFHMNGGYFSDLNEFIMARPQIKLWTCGHTHHSHRYYMGDTLVACNPRGYAGSEKSADNFKLKYIDLNALPDKALVGADYAWENTSQG